MSKEIFDHLEGGGSSSGEAKEVVARLNPFEHLEIGDCRTSAPQKPKAPTGILCPYCHQANERERETCWACYKGLVKPKPEPKPPAQGNPQELTLVIDGNTYRSGDPDLPPDIAELIDRIQKRGYSQELLVEWQNWRATRNIGMANERAGDEDVKVFKGQRVSVIRLDGKVYTSDDPDLAPEMRRLFSYLDQKGVTPELMEQLRGMGGKVKYRPAVTASPSDGDLAFWQDVAANRRAAQPAPTSWGQVFLYLALAFTGLIVINVLRALRAGFQY